MKKIIAVFVFFLCAWQINAESATDPYFLAMYQKAIEWNQNFFKDVNFIPEGSLVRLPQNLVTDDTLYFIAGPPVSGQHDCIWRLTERVVAIYDPLEDVPDVVVPDSQDEVAPTEAMVWPSLLTSLLIGLLILLVIWQIFRKDLRQFWQKRHPDSYPPVMSNGLDDNSEIARQQIINLLSDDTRTAVKVENGVLVRHYGPKKLSVWMQFADHQRAVDIKSGEKMVRVTFDNNEVEYYRNRCGNRTAQIWGGNEGPLQIPSGWQFVVNNIFESEQVEDEILNRQKTARDDQQQTTNGTPAETVLKIIKKMPKKFTEAVIEVTDASGQHVQVVFSGKARKKQKR